jgi:hypothetical protein
VWRILAHARAATDCLSRRHEFASVQASGGITQAESKNCKNACQMAISMVRKFDVPGRASPLDSVPAARKRGVGNTGFALQKKFERISPKSAMRRVARRRIGRIGAKRFAKQGHRLHSARR